MAEVRSGDDGTTGATQQDDERPLDFCSLDADELRERIALVRREIAPFATAQHQRAGGIAWDFQRSDGLRRKLEDLVELERACCSGLRWTLSDDPVHSRLRLEVLGREADASSACGCQGSHSTS